MIMICIQPLLHQSQIKKNIILKKKSSIITIIPVEIHNKIQDVCKLNLLDLVSLIIFQIILCFIISDLFY